MNIQTLLTTAFVLCLTLAFHTGCSSSEPSSEPSNDQASEPAKISKQGTLVSVSSDKPGEITQMISVTATVAAIDMNTRELTIVNLEGQAITFLVDEEVQRLDEFKRGDKIKVDYYVSLASEIREPTAEEKENPLVMIAGAGKASDDTAPAAAGLRQFKAVVTIVGIDRSAEMVTLQGPRGNYLITRVLHPSRLEKVKVGDTVIVTYTEAMAVSLEKVD